MDAYFYLISRLELPIDLIVFEFNVNIEFTIGFNDRYRSFFLPSMLMKPTDIIVRKRDICK